MRRMTSASVLSSKERVRRSMRRSWKRSSARTVSSGGRCGGYCASIPVMRPAKTGPADSGGPKATAKALPKSSTSRSKKRKPTSRFFGPQLRKVASQRNRPRVVSSTISDWSRKSPSASCTVPSTRIVGRAPKSPDFPWFDAISTAFPYQTRRRDNQSARIRSRRARIRSAIRSTSRSEEHTSELQSHSDLVCRLLLEKKKKILKYTLYYSKKKNNRRTN